MATPDKKYEFTKLIENINKSIQRPSLKYPQVCFLLAALVSSAVQKTVINGTNNISRIFNETLKDKEGGCAIFWYVLTVTEACGLELRDKLKTYIKEPFTVPEKLTPMVHLRVMLLKIANEINIDRSRELVNIAGSMFEPEVGFESLDFEKFHNEDRNNIAAMLRFFEIAMEQLKVEPSKLTNLCKWLNDVGCRRQIKEYNLENFNCTEEITIPGE